MKAHRRVLQRGAKLFRLQCKQLPIQLHQNSMHIRSVVTLRFINITQNVMGFKFVI
jgi:hypothetical protein